MVESKMTKRVYLDIIDVTNARGRHLVKWEERVLEYVREKGERRMRGLEHARRECKDRNK